MNMKQKTQYAAPEAEMLAPILKSAILDASVILPETEWRDEVEL